MEQRLRETIVRLLMDGETLSLEQSKGQTYQSADATLYALGVYEGSSVLAGQQKRTNVHSWESYEEAKSVLGSAAGVPYEDLYEIGGTSYIPVDRMVAHLSDEPDTPYSYWTGNGDEDEES